MHRRIMDCNKTKICEHRAEIFLSPCTFYMVIWVEIIDDSSIDPLHV